MTSVDGINQLGNEAQVNREKGDPQLKRIINRIKLSS